MISDVLAVAWKEWRDFLGGSRFRRGGPLHVLAVPPALGLLLPWLLRPAFPNPWLLGLVPAVFAAASVVATVADSLAGERERNTLEVLLATRLPGAALVLGKVATLTALGWASATAVLLFALLGSSVLSLGAADLGADPGVVAAAEALALASALLVAAMGAVISQFTTTVKQTQQMLGTAVVVVAVGAWLGVQLMPESWSLELIEAAARHGSGPLVAAGIAALFAVDAALLAAAVRLFSRERLLLK